ncbi:MAG: hypothetical protein ACAH83_18485 [Alphaproteobacteria bacterium]
MKSTVIIASLFALVSFGAQAQTSSGYSGGQNASAPNTAVPVAASGSSGVSGTSGATGARPPAMPLSSAPVAAPAPAPAMTTTTGAAPAGVKTTDTKKVDPCSAYMYDMNAYAMCNDRIMKLQRLKDAKAARDKTYETPAPAVAAAPAAAAPVAAAPNGAPPANAAAGTVTPAPAPVANTTIK